MHPASAQDLGCKVKNAHWAAPGESEVRVELCAHGKHAPDFSVLETLPLKSLLRNSYTIGPRGLIFQIPS